MRPRRVVRDVAGSIARHPVPRRHGADRTALRRAARLTGAIAHRVNAATSSTKTVTASSTRVSQAGTPSTSKLRAMACRTSAIASSRESPSPFAPPSESRSACAHQAPSWSYSIVMGTSTMLIKLLLSGSTIAYVRIVTCARSTGRGGGDRSVRLRILRCPDSAGRPATRACPGNSRRAVWRGALGSPRCRGDLHREPPSGRRGSLAV